MADTKFKIGDKVRNARNGFEGRVGTIDKVDDSDIPYRLLFDDGETGWHTARMVQTLSKSSEPKPKPTLPPKLILQYELDADPFEFFATEKEARKRIAELAQRTDLKRDSIRLIEIKKIRTVKLGVQISISK